MLACNRSTLVHNDGALQASQAFVDLRSQLYVLKQISNLVTIPRTDKTQGDFPNGVDYAALTVSIKCCPLAAEWILFQSFMIA